jgi:hypothetical protein
MEMTNNLSKLLEDIKKTQAIAEHDLTDSPWQTRTAKEIAKSEAKRDLVPLKAKYLKEFSTKIAKVFVDGTPEQVKLFTELLNKEGATTFTSSNIYRYIAENVAPKLSYGSAFSSSAWVRLMEILGDVCRTYDVFPHTSPKEPNAPAIRTETDLVEVVKSVIRESFGDTLNRIYLTSNVLDSALSNRFEKDVAVVIVSGLSEPEKASLMDSLFPGQPSFSLTLATDEVPDKSTALKVYRRVYEAFSKKAAKKTNTETTKVESHQ